VSDLERETRDPAFEELLEYLRDVRGFDFTGYKRASLVRRVDKRMQSIGIGAYAEYLDHLQVHQEEFTDLFNFILINVTSFFRDAPVWAYLGETILPRILERKDAEGSVRVWCAGCASGEEAYSVAMVLAEHLGEDRFRRSVKIYATDIDDEAIAQARQGVYSAKAVEDVSAERLARFFERSGHSYVFHRDLRRALIFGRHDLVQDAPISKTDLITCRNTLMYLNADTQLTVLEKFRFSLAESAFLILGKSEMLFTKVPAFAPVDLKLRVFTARPSEGERDRMGGWFGEDEARADDTGDGVRQLAFDEGPTAQLLVAADGRLLTANRRARDLFGVDVKDAGKPLQDLEVSYRPVELRGPIDDALRTGEPVELRDVAWRSREGAPLTLVVRVSRLGSADEAGAAVVSFADISATSELQHDLETSNQELETAMEELQSTNEELETTNEELQSTNEELETTNEELQSTNEELETMNEELQSTNEELRTVNEELHERSQELGSVNTFMGAILGGVRAGVVVLDENLRVQVWNARVHDLWGLRAEEVIGHSLMSLEIGLPLDPVREQIRRTLAAGSDHTTIEVDATDRLGKAIRVRITCSRLEPGAGHGVILLMEDVPAGG
jgi:two-component system, chemotaxis family, CheB/CheR fusion protein